MVDGRSQGKDGKRCSVRARGLKAGAGLRGPYGTSVRHICPTWILIPTVTLISTPLSFSLSFPPLAPIFSKEFSFLDLPQRSNIHMHSVLFSFHASISGLPVFCFFFFQAIVIHPKISHFLFCIFCSTYTVYHRKRIPNISIPSVMLYQCDNIRSFALCTPSELAPLPPDRDEKVPSNFITHQGTISIMKYFGEYFGPRVNSIRL